MRYRENIPPDQVTGHAGDDMMLFTAILGLVIGIALVWLGKKGKQTWLVVWSIGLIICSIGVAVWIAFLQPGGAPS